MSDPGNTLSTATSLILTNTAQPFSDSVDNADRLDYFRFTLGRSSSLNVVLGGLNGDANLALIRDANANGAIEAGEIMAQSTNTGSLAELINKTPFAAGDYYLEVSYGSGATVNYTLSSAAQPAVSAPAAIDWRNPTTGDLSVWLMNGTTIADTATLPAPTNWQILGRGDFDNNGTSDLFWRETTTGNTHVWLMNGTTIADSGMVVAGVANAWQSTQFADFNGDGKTDVLWRNSQTGELGLWMMNGKTASQFGTFAVELAWQVQGAGDLNGDGKADLVWRKTTTGEAGFG